MFTADKVTELFCMADDLASLISNSASFFDKMTAKYTLKSENKRPYHRDSTMSKAEIVHLKRRIRRTKKLPCMESMMEAFFMKHSLFLCCFFAMSLLNERLSKSFSALPDFLQHHLVPFCCARNLIAAVAVGVGCEDGFGLRRECHDAGL